MNLNKLNSHLKYNYSPKFPGIEELTGSLKIITSFSHANPNLHINEINSNAVLLKIRRRNRLENRNILNIMYDNAIPSNDTPKGHRIQYGVINPRIMSPEVPYSFQKTLHYDYSKILKNNQNTLFSLPDKNQKIFKQRITEVHSILNKQINKTSDSPVDSIRNIRKSFFNLLNIKPVPETAFSTYPTKLLSKILLKLARNGYPFWELPVPEEFSKYKKKTFLVEGINKKGCRVPVTYKNNQFEFPYSDAKKIKIDKNNIFKKIARRKVIPTMPLIILGLAVAPRIIHIGGKSWPKYAAPIAGRLIKWLNMDINPSNIIKSTQTFNSPYVYRKSQRFYGFPLIYSSFGAEFLNQNLNKSENIKIQLQKEVISGQT
ncbi:MAG: hypothetical protein ACQEQC_08730 [Elusimicrobiota bacterium]